MSIKLLTIHKKLLVKFVSSQMVEAVYKRNSGLEFVFYRDTLVSESKNNLIFYSKRYKLPVHKTEIIRLFDGDTGAIIWQRTG